MKIYLVRHGETEWNIEGKMQGWEDSKLTEQGVQNAQSLGQYLEDIEFDCAYSSPLGRTIETTENILGEKKCSIILKDAFKEMNFGVFEGMYHQDIKEKYPEQHKNLWYNPHLYEPINGETFKELIDRVEKGLQDIIENCKGENVLLVTHAGVIKAIYLIIKKCSLDKFWSGPFIYQTCVTVIEVVDNEMKITIEADTPHLA